MNFLTTQNLWKLDNNQSFCVDIFNLDRVENVYEIEKKKQDAQILYYSYEIETLQ